MFYNFILPGGIGGDAYKVLKIKTDYGYGHLPLARVVLFDRISGLVALCNLAFLLIHIITVIPYVYVVWAIVLTCNLVYYTFFCSYFFPALLSFKTELLSWLVQLMQCVCAFCIVSALGLHHNQIHYLFVFLVSSIVSVLPVSIGGLGAREYTFLTASAYFALDKDAAVCIGLLFYLISLVVSLAGIYFIFRPIKKMNSYVTT
jgi:glycosyltransferase 2 family protein